MNDTYSYDKEEIKEILDYAIRKIEQNISTIKDQQIEIDRLKKELEISRNIPYNYNYEKGAYTEIPMAWDESSRRLTIGARKGSYPGMLESRKFTVRMPDGKEKTVNYTGKKVSVKL